MRIRPSAFRWWFVAKKAYLGGVVVVVSDGSVEVGVVTCTFCMNKSAATISVEI
jgi:hypothetical protein